MSGIGSQAGSFQTPHIPSKSAAQRKSDEQGAIAKSTKTVSKPTQNTQSSSKPSPQSLPEKQTELAQEKHNDNIQNIRNSVAKNRLQADSFHKKQSSDSTDSGKDKNLSELANQVKKDEDLKSRAREFAQKINNSQARLNKSRIATTDKPEMQQNHQIAAQAVQSKEESSSKKKNKNSKSNTDAQLERIFTLGGERGRKFVAYIKREQAKGPLSDSVVELVSDFHSTLKGDSLSAAELLQTGDENISLIKSMVSSDNLMELDSINDVLANSVTNSAGERSALLAIRNLEKNQSRVVPPSPEQEIKRQPTEVAIEFVSSINYGSIIAPWDNNAGAGLLQAA